MQLEVEEQDMGPPQELPKLVPLAPFPPGENPFLHDSHNMGTRMGKDLVLMHGNHDTEDCKYLIFVNTKTGKRFRMEFAGAENAVMADNLLQKLL